MNWLWLLSEGTKSDGIELRVERVEPCWVLLRAVDVGTSPVVAVEDGSEREEDEARSTFSGSPGNDEDGGGDDDEGDVGSDDDDDDDNEDETEEEI